MILEKAQAKINGGYDQIEGGKNKNIFELFLGCRCKCFNLDNIDNIDKIYKSIKKNEKYFGTLSLCSSSFYDILNKMYIKIVKLSSKQNLLIK